MQGCFITQLFCLFLKFFGHKLELLDFLFYELIHFFMVIGKKGFKLGLLFFFLLIITLLHFNLNILLSIVEEFCVVCIQNAIFNAIFLENLNGYFFFLLKFHRVGWNSFPLLILREFVLEIELDLLLIRFQLIELFLINFYPFFQLWF